MYWLKKNKITLTIILFCCSFLFFQLQSAGAQGGFLWENTGNCYSSGTCSSCDIVQIIVNIGVFLLGIVGAVALVFFTYGAFILLTSGGVGERVQKAKGIMTNAIIGLIIALSAYFIVTTVISIITGGWTWEGKLTCPTAAPPPSPAPSVPPASPSPTRTMRACGTLDHCCQYTEFSACMNQSEYNQYGDPTATTFENCPPLTGSGQKTDCDSVGRSKCCICKNHSCPTSLHPYPSERITPPGY